MLTVEWERHLGCKSSDSEAPGRWYKMKLGLLFSWRPTFWKTTFFFFFFKFIVIIFVVTTWKTLFKTQVLSCPPSVERVSKQKLIWVGRNCSVSDICKLEFQLNYHWMSLQLSKFSQHDKRQIWHSNNEMTKWFIHVLQV